MLKRYLSVAVIAGCLVGFTVQAEMVSAPPEESVNLLNLAGSTYAAPPELGLIDDEVVGAGIFFAAGKRDGFASELVVNSAVPEVPLPAAAWLLLSGLAGLLGVSRRKRV